MRAWLLSLALCYLAQRATAQNLLYTIPTLSGSGVAYSIREADAPIDLENDVDPCLASSERLVVWESKHDYKEFIDALVAGSDANDGDTFRIAIKTADDQAEARTLYSNRFAPYVNFENYGLASLTGGLFTARMMFHRTQNPNFHYSPWDFVAPTLTTGELFICMDAEDAGCIETDECPQARIDTRVPDKSCFWRPYPRCPFTWKEAKAVCHKSGGGHLMDLRDASDITIIAKHHENDPTYSGTWVGMTQAPGEATPTWTNGEHPDEISAWLDLVQYGSSSYYFPYAGIWFADDAKMNLFETASADFSERKAFAMCEATKEDYCKYNSKDVKYADKSVCCDYETLRYTCKPGWWFPDGTTEKEVPCGCEVDFESQYVPDCILKNPCKDEDNHYCEPHGECIFTNQWQKPYYCVCGPGFKWEDHNCVDINECEENPCGHYGGHCMNTVGSYWCNCNKGWSWENNGDNGYCSEDRPTVVAVHTMTIYFLLNMDYDPHMNEPGHEAYERFMDAIEELTEHVYIHERITVDSFHISEEAHGRMKVKVVFNLYIAADPHKVSTYVYKFYTYIKDADYFTVNYNTYPYYGSVYYQSATLSTNIAITSPCSIFDHTEQCHGSYCRPDGYAPKCHCKEGYYGTYCDEKDDVKDPWAGELSGTEIGLIVAVCILFLLVICMPFCLLCCFMNCRWFQARKRRHHHEPEFYTNSAYAQSPTYVTKTQVATRYPKFAFVK